MRGPSVAVVRGCRTRTEKTFHAEFAAALHWLGGGLLIVVTGTSALLATTMERPKSSGMCILDAREASRHPVEEHAGKAQPEPYTLVLQVEPANLDRLVGASESLSRALAR